MAHPATLGSNPNQVSLTGKGGLHKENLPLVRLMLESLNMPGIYHLTMVAAIRGSGHTKGVQIGVAEVTGVRLNVQGGDNGSRQECRLVGNGMTPAVLRGELIDRLGGTTEWHTGITRPVGRTVPPATVNEVLTSTPPPPKAAATENAPTAGSETAPKRPSIRGASTDETLVILVLNGIYLKCGTQLWSTENFHEMSAQEGWFGQGVSHHSLGQFLRRMHQYGFISDPQVISGVRHYRLTLKGCTEGRRAGGTSETPAPAAPAPEAKQPTSASASPVDIGKLSEKLAGLGALIKSHETAQSDLAQVDKRLGELRAEIAMLEGKRQGLKQTIDDPRVAEARTLIETLGKLIG